MTTVVLVHRHTEHAIVIQFHTPEGFPAFLTAVRSLCPDRNYEIDPESTHEE
jgi:hypothetical protein